ncbi:hypothetical protein F4779DRAFT_616893 [Xylariaceae sp. FL0662B]|nr:hypothetical protein F4779DRAFT_616893 [Xylariaceae sp. FL0662B]
MEAAGVALGALPIALYAIDNYHRCLKPARNYLDYKRTLQEIRRNLFVQQQQLQVTLQNIGLQNPTLDQTKEKLRQLYPGCFEEFMEILAHMDEILASLMTKLDVDFNGKPKWTEDAPERASWEWRKVKRSFKHTQRRDLFNELQNWNNALRNCLERKREIPSDESDPLTAGFKFHSTLCDEARKNAGFIHEALAVAWTTGCPHSHHPSNVELTIHQRGFEDSQLNLTIPVPETATSASMLWQRVVVKVESSPTNTTDSSSKMQRTASSFPNPIPTTAAPLPLVSHPRKKYLHFFQDSSSIQTSESAILSSGPDYCRAPKESHKASKQEELNCSQLITSLCTLIQEKQWSGYLIHSGSDRERVIHMRKMTSPQMRLSSLPLSKLLSKGAPRLRPLKSHLSARRISRRDRFGIAAAASWAVLLLCGTPWLEESWIGKDDMTLLVDESDSSGPSRRATTPAFSYTFKSGTTNPGTIEGNRVNSFQGNQIRHKTLFALGILLIELGLDISFDQLRSEAQAEGLDADGSLEDDYEIANRIIDSQSLELEVGESYSHAVQRCIQCHFLGSESTQNFSHTSFRKQFFTGVVAPVQATFDGQITSAYALKVS